ncbi:MAG TPA: DNA primase [Ignavibacteriaceae bacterium]|nr:DNA primase [Ignavibacteriaceae bacterium]
MRIPESKIEEIRESVDIVDVISQHVQLRKRGKNFIGLCPFHSEKTPSFTVSEEKQIFHCFGCHTGGNVFKFLTEFHKISFVEAVQELAEQQGITIEFDKQEYTEQQSEQEVLYDINTEAARYFLNNLLNDDEGEFARKYLHERNIKTQTLRSFGLGYSLRGWENFISYAKSRSLNVDKCIQLGLIGKNADGKLYDKLPGRLIFPIFSPNGRVVAFAGRVLDPKDTGAKYINSPESLIYIKGRILYGLSFAKDDIRRLDKAIIVEGYMDLISLYQSGIKNVVAVSGTALTDDQVQLLSRYTKNVVLLFDADVAGIKASMRSIEILLKRDMEVKIVSLPKGEDPDSYVNKFGKDEFEELIKRAENFLEYESKYYESQGKFEDPSTAAEAIRELVKPVALINDELKRNLLIRNIAQKFNLREKLIESELDKQIKQFKRFERTDSKVLQNRKAEETTSTLIDAVPEISPVLYNLEREIIKLLFEADRPVAELIFNYLHPEDFTNSLNRELFEKVKDEFENEDNFTTSGLVSVLKDERKETYVRELTFDKYSVSSSWEERFPSITAEITMMRFAKDTVMKFVMERIEKNIQSNRREIELSDDEKKQLELMKANNELEREKKRIREELSQ